MERKSSRGNPWHDEKGRFCSGPINAEIVGGDENSTIYEGKDLEKEIERLGLMPEMTDDYGYPIEEKEDYDERSPGGAFPEVEVELNNDNTGTVYVIYQGEEYSQNFNEVDGEIIRKKIDGNFKRSEKKDYSEQTKYREKHKDDKNKPLSPKMLKRQNTELKIIKNLGFSKYGKTETDERGNISGVYKDALGNIIKYNGAAKGVLYNNDRYKNVSVALQTKEKEITMLKNSFVVSVFGERKHVEIVDKLPQQGQFGNGYKNVGRINKLGKTYDIYIDRSANGKCYALLK